MFTPPLTHAEPVAMGWMQSAGESLHNFAAWATTTRIVQWIKEGFCFSRDCVSGCYRAIGNAVSQHPQGAKVVAIALVAAAAIALTIALWKRFKPCDASSHVVKGSVLIEDVHAAAKRSTQPNRPASDESSSQHERPIGTALTTPST